MTRRCAVCGLPLGVGTRPYQRYCDAACKYRARASKAGRRPLPTLDERLWGRLVEEGECWIFQGSRGSHGYGQIVVDGKQTSTHRVAYQLLRGDIPTGLEMDHLCRNRACCNPWHLEPVTTRENQLRRYRPDRAHARPELVTRDTPSTWTEWTQ